MFSEIFDSVKNITFSIYMYTILYFVPEVALIAIMSQSIKWSLFTYEKYQIAESKKKDTMTEDESLKHRDSVMEERSHVMYGIYDDETYSNSSMNDRTADRNSRMINAFSANGDLRSVLVRDSQKFENDRILNRITI